MRRLFACFYADDRLLTARKPKHLQLALNLQIGLFDRVGLQTDFLKTESMVFLPSRIRTCLSEEAYCSTYDGPFGKGIQKGAAGKVQALPEVV